MNRRLVELELSTTVPICGFFMWLELPDGGLRVGRLLTWSLKVPRASASANRKEVTWLLLTSLQKSHGVTVCILLMFWSKQGQIRLYSKVKDIDPTSQWEEWLRIWGYHF